MPTERSRPTRFPSPPSADEAFKAGLPTGARAYDSLGEAVRRAGPLRERGVALVKLALSLGFPPMMAGLGWVEVTIEGKKKGARKQ